MYIVRGNFKHTECIPHAPRKMAERQYYACRTCTEVFGSSSGLRTHEAECRGKRLKRCYELAVGNLTDTSLVKTEDITPPTTPDSPSPTTLDSPSPTTPDSPSPGLSGHTFKVGVYESHVDQNEAVESEKKDHARALPSETTLATMIRKTAQQFQNFGFEWPQDIPRAVGIPLLGRTGSATGLCVFLRLTVDQRLSKPDFLIIEFNLTPSKRVCEEGFRSASRFRLHQAACKSKKLKRCYELAQENKTTYKNMACAMDHLGSASRLLEFSIRGQMPCVEGISTRDHNLLNECPVSTVSVTLPHIVKMVETTLLVTATGEDITERCLNGSLASTTLSAGTFLVDTSRDCTIFSSNAWTYAVGHVTTDQHEIADSSFLKEFSLNPTYKNMIL
ncbi:hypothetical protein CAPTEDRAFT_205775 [Capitella teleta]|uniref:C2H2-type domain-containing protein n=1 Tax=Capitella teleta TaxID=283909 RepID=R7U4Z8_CAPTE|nr:hypothetical protein CAPTEDRAFT_205775 [Capitella teleta]|eukprot:ELU01201.1 hypothetical protein CAPTEDRAFT_205775 [Capitella teleta]